ncbi:MAG: hypothetical protein ACLFU1_08955 [Alphaproteobacteria bacterium]
MYYRPYAYPMLADDTYLITGLFDSDYDLAKLLAELDSKGYKKDDVSIVMSDDTRNKSFKIEKGTKATETAAGVGGLTGLAGAIILGLGSAATTGATGGLNLVVAGPLLSTLAGFGGGAAIGGVIGALAGTNMPEYEIEFTRKHLENGHILVAIKAADKDKADQLRTIFKAHGAIETNEELEQQKIAQGR